MDLPGSLDLWAPVSWSDLPTSLVESVRVKDWQRAKDDLSKIMDALITDGVYGRALLQLVMQLPTGLYPVFDRYRAAVAIDHGDWDTVRELNMIPQHDEFLGVRDVILAPLNCVSLPEKPRLPHIAMHLAPYEYEMQRAAGKWRRWAQRHVNFQPQFLLAREGIPAGRHARYRRLHDTMALAVGEALSGRLTVAIALSREAQRLGDEGEPYRLVAHDLAELATLAAGQAVAPTLKSLRHLAQPTGFSPLGAWDVIFQLAPFLALLGADTLDWAARLGERIAVRLGSPRGQLQAETWRVAAALLQSANKIVESELPGLLTKSRRAAPGLRSVPLLLDGFARHRVESLAEAERASRSVGNVWTQISALTWMIALNPTPKIGHWLYRLLELTGWRRLVLVPPQISADAALGLVAMGCRGVSLVELALVAGRPNVTVEVARRHIEDAEAPAAARIAAVEALGKVGTTHAREILHRVARRTDDVGNAARRLLATRTYGTTLSEREMEVLDLARHGLTNREIADRLTLSPHTVARHLANARAKLGAANRTEAAAKLEEISR